MKSSGYLPFPSYFLAGTILLGISTSVTAQQANKDYLDPRLPVEQRVEALLGQMTLEEKVGQMCMANLHATNLDQIVQKGQAGSLVGFNKPATEINRLQRLAMEGSRLRIPLLIGLDVVHGYSTVFPIPLAEASSWNPDKVKACASITAKEASSQGIRWTMSPMVDIARDPRWSRIAEGSGEDPFLGMAMAKAMVEGYQGPQLSTNSGMVACVKHFAGYGAAEGGRDYNTTEISERTLREIYLPPFKAAVDAGAGTIMSAFNDLNGIPASANPFLLQGILKGEWGFQGVVRADANADAELVNHGIAGDTTQAASKSVTAGEDMAFSTYMEHMVQLVQTGAVPMSRVDDAVRRLLRIKFEIGLFENPYVDLDQAKASLLLPENRKAARELAEQSIVLLKNDANVLPLNKDVKTIAVIGPLANDKPDMLGCWDAKGQPGQVVTLLDGIRSKISPSTKILYAEGCRITGTNTSGFSNALDAARQADVVVISVGESASMTGEARSRSSLDVPGVQEQLVQEVSRLGKPMVEVLMNGRPLSIGWDAEHVPAILETWFLGTEAGNAIADVLFGDYNPSGKLPVTFPRTVGQVPMYYNHKNTGRPASDIHFSSKYTDIPWTPLYPFGYGLSYTTFAFYDLTVTPDTNTPDQFNVSVKVTNTGTRSGAELAQLYIRQASASVTRPIKQLEGFQRVALAPGESALVRFTLTPFDLSFYNLEMQRMVEAGDLEVMVGDSSADVISKTVQIEKTMPVGSEVSRSFGNL
jgi:beta-glucosidase